MSDFATTLLVNLAIQYADDPTPRNWERLQDIVQEWKSDPHATLQPTTDSMAESAVIQAAVELDPLMRKLADWGFASQRPEFYRDLEAAEMCASKLHRAVADMQGKAQLGDYPPGVDPCVGCDAASSCSPVQQLCDRKSERRGRN